MRIRLFAFSVFAMAIGIGEVASATTVLTFENFAPTGSFTALSTTKPYTDTSNGETFQVALTNSGSAAWVFGDNYTKVPFPGSPADNSWLGFRGGSSVTLSVVGGATFSLNSLDLGPANTTKMATVTLTAYLPSGATLTSVTFKGLTTETLETLPGNWTGLSKVTISSNGYTGVDNMTLNDPPTVPEPSSVVLATIGLLAGSVVVKFGRRN